MNIVKDTSIFERDIRGKVMDMCVEAIVSEAFIESLPIKASELDDGLIHGLASYATECMKDLGSARLLTEAIESTKQPAKKAYLKRIQTVCMETATTVTDRILKEAHGDAKALQDASRNVTLTSEEYARFSKAAATLTPESLTKMIQKKALDTIKEEKEAYKKEEELKTELVNALAEADADEEHEQISTDPINNSDNDAATGADIGHETDMNSPEAAPGEESHFVDVQNDTQKRDQKDPKTGIEIGRNTDVDLSKKGNASESHFVDVQNESQKRDAKCEHVGARIGQACCPECAKNEKDAKKAEKAFESYMRSMAGDNYRTHHASVFSRLQELAYEGIRATTESFTDIPFDTMTAITKENTFSRFASHGTKDARASMESIARYAFESAATPDTPEAQQGQLANALLVASIIYTFFETLNSMNLYCPKLDEIKRFVDETLPIEGKVLQDKKAFENLFRSMISTANASIQKATTTQELDVIEKDLEIVREKAGAPGFESMQADIVEKIDEVLKKVDAKRDVIVASKRPIGPAVESMTQTMQRTRDTLKFSRVASTMGRKPNVTMVKCKIDPQKNQKYVAVEAFTADNRLAGSTNIVLESTLMGDTVDYVTAAVNASNLTKLDKRVVISDLRSGKIYMDTAK